MRIHQFPESVEHIEDTAKRMVDLANVTKESVTADFDGIELTAKPGDNPDSVVEYYRMESHIRRQCEF